MTLPRYNLRTLVFFVPLAIVWYPCVGLGAMFWMYAFAPLVFMVDCSFTNATSETVYVTPVGTVGSRGDRRLLPLFRTTFPHFFLKNRSDFRVDPGATLRFDYDMDDINFSEIVIQHHSGATGQIVVNPTPLSPQYVDPPMTDFVLDDFSKLQPVPPSVAAAVSNSKRSSSRLTFYSFCLLAVVLEVVRHASWNGYKFWRGKKAIRPTATAPVNH